MGSLCMKSQDIQLKRCSMCSNKDLTQNSKPFIECGHLICEICLSQNTISQVTCPMQHKKTNPVAQLGRQLYNSVRKNPDPYQLCSKKHKMIWKDQFQLCSRCNIHLHGFQCRLCNQIICTLCSDVFDLNKIKCPNKHNLVWRTTFIPCLICGVKKYGWSCCGCRWYSCVNCCKTKYNPNTCPNNHALIWKNTKQACFICKETQRCFRCETCLANFCLKCTNFQYNKSLCPNKHKTLLVQKHCCTKCELQMPGMFCLDCNYHFCTKCQIQKYSTTFQNRNQTYQSIRIVVQNPLFQFQQFQQKSSIEAMKKAAEKIKRIPTLEIQIEQEHTKNINQQIVVIEKQANLEYKTEKNIIQNQNQQDKILIEQHKQQPNEIIQIQSKQVEIQYIIKQTSPQKIAQTLNIIQQVQTKQIKDQIIVVQKQIQQDPLNIQLYEKLANVHRQKGNKIQEISVYQTIIQIQQSKDNKDSFTISRICMLALDRTNLLGYKKPALLFIQKLIKLSQISQNQDMMKIHYWKLNKIQLLIDNKQIKEAQQQFLMLKPEGDQYQKIKILLQLNNK